MEPTLVQISDNCRLVYRKHPDAGLFSLVGVTEGGLRGDGSLLGLNNCFANLLGTANRRMDYGKLLQEVEGSGTILAGFSGKDSLGLKMQCFGDQFHHMSRLWSECLLQPVFPDPQWEITQLEVRDELRSENDSAANVAIKKFQSLMYGDHPYHSPIYGNEKIISSENASSLNQNSNNTVMVGNGLFGAVGNIDESEIVDHLKEILGDWKPAGKGI